MKNQLFFPLVFVLSGSCILLAADAPAVKLTQEAKSIKVELGGQPFTTYYFADGLGLPYVRPFCWPLLASDGTCISSDQGQVKGGDHPHHRSLWVAHGEVNGADHWMWKDTSAKQRHVGFTKVEGDTIVEQLEWEGKTPETILKETRTLRFFAFPDGARGVDVSSTYEAVAAKVTLGDTKEAGLCSVRVAKDIAKTALLTNAAGGSGEKACWGKRAVWCDISGTIEGKPYGVAILDHPTNPRSPSYWHVRQYGLLAANSFGLSYYDKANPKGSGDFVIESGKPVTFRFRVVIHTGDAKSANLDAKFKEFSEAK